ncbi:MAG: HAD domain-containing protein [Fusobacteria bacterium]|nr:HAD domain-containing protein [Fusobacteriota bacterium]
MNSTEQVDKVCLKRLKSILDTTGAIVIMPSGWRLWFDENMQPIDGDTQYLHRKLQEFGIHIEGKTPDLSTEEIRQKRIFSHVKAKEILAWLTIHTEVTHYVVLDDLNLHNEEI